MYIFQFQADVTGPNPVVLDLAEAVSEYGASARMMYEQIGMAPGQWDRWGTRHANYELSAVSVTGTMYCRSGGTREPAERMARRLIGSKGWLIGYRFDRCGCLNCQGECVCGSSLRRGHPPTWYATTARLAGVEGSATHGMDYLERVAGASPRLSFTVERPWERITPDLWTYGDLRLTNPNPHIPHLGSGQNEDALITPRHWPMRLTPPPIHGYWWRRPLAWMENKPWIYETCVGHWSAGGWLNGRIGTLIYRPDGSIQRRENPGVHHIVNPGDWPSSCRLAFSNFSRIQVRIYNQGNFQAEVELRTPVSSPQYLYIDTDSGECSIRYCPVSDNPCVDLSELATFVPEVETPLPAAAVVRGVLPASIQPGINRLEVLGFRMPGLPFVWSYDQVPLYS